MPAGPAASREKLTQETTGGNLLGRFPRAGPVVDGPGVYAFAVPVFTGAELGWYEVLVVAVGGAILAYFGARWFERPAVRWGLVSRRRRDRFSARRISLAGGPGLLIGCIAVYAALRRAPPAGVIVGGLGFFGLGLWDDRFELRPFQKASLQTLIAIVAAALLVPGPVDIGVGVLIFLILVNASNYLDNMDGLLTGVALAQAAALVLVRIELGPGAAPLLFALPGILLLTWAPATVYLGDSGSHLVGALFAAETLQILYEDGSAHPVRIVPLLVLFGVPLLDAATVSISRLRRKRPLFRGGTDHLSHRLVRLGFPVRGAVTVLVLASAVCGIASLVLAHF